MPFCSNPDCPHKEKTGHFAEYRDDMTRCPECNSLLTENPIALPGNVEKVDSDLINKILITIGLLVFTQLLYLIPLPGLDLSGLPDSLLKRYFDSSRVSICALGIMPYISAYIFVEFFSLVIPPLKRWRDQKGEGRRKLTITARWVTLFISLIQGFGISKSFEKMSLPDGSLVVGSPGLEFTLIVVITLTACVFINLWIADQITAKGIGNGISMIIFSTLAISIFSDLFTTIQKTFSVGNPMAATVTIIFVLAIIFVAGAFVLFMEKSDNNVKVRLENNNLVDLPFKYNTAGIVPATFAVSIVMLPATQMFIGNYHKFYEYFQYGTLTYYITYTIIMVVLFFLFTALYFDPDKILSFLRSKNAAPVLPEGVSFEKLLDKKNTLFAVYGVIYLFVYSVILSPAIHVFIVISGLALIRVVSISLDIINEVKARKNGYFVKIVEFQKPYEAKFAKNLLEQNNIPCFLEGYYHRGLLYFFGPFIEISLYVQRDKKIEAFRVIQ